MRVQILLPDTLIDPMGGMGEQCRHMIRCMAALDPHVLFDVIGGPSQPVSTGSNYHYTPMDELRLPLGSSSPLARTIATQLPLFATALQSRKPDIVHAFDWSCFMAGAYTARAWQCPLVVSVQLSYLKLLEDGVVKANREQQLSDLNLAMELQGMMAADVIIQVSQSYAERFSTMYDTKTVVIPNGIELNEWVSGENAELPGSRRFKLVYIGRFDWMKNITALLDASLPEDVDLILIGGSRGSVPELQDLVVKHAEARDNVHYLGPRYGREKVALLSAADAMIVPSLHEPFGIVALEAMASRSLLLSSFRGGMADFVSDDVAINCGVTPDSITQAIQAALRLPETERERRLVAGHAVCEQYAWKSQAQKLHHVYNHMMNRNCSPSEHCQSNG